ncbi:hypothetical protein [Capnocytophaga canis]|uniref:hypothetical protein n=1 Tax=Capnocytophaga canis TaxID=1848903 RepID=UPI0015627E29|nr:hypothetical protein [Capnocytophaga canis]
MFKPEKNKEKELIEAIYKLVKELKEENQEAETPVPANIQSFLDFLKSSKGRHLLRLLSFIISLGVMRLKEEDYTVSKIWNYIDEDLRSL